MIENAETTLTISFTRLSETIYLFRFFLNNEIRDMPAIQRFFAAVYFLCKKKIKLFRGKLALKVVNILTVADGLSLSAAVICVTISVDYLPKSVIIES